MKPFYFLILIFPLFFSCKDKKQEETLDLSEITTSSVRYKEGLVLKDSVVSIPQFTDGLTLVYKNLIDSLGVDYSVVLKLDTVLFADRFGAKSIVKFYWKEKNDSINFIDWEFKDSTKTENAFYNWLDCFGANCKSVKIGDKARLQKRSLLLLLNEKHLIWIDANTSIEQEKWLKILKDQQFGENWKYILYQSKNKKDKLVWSSSKNEVISEIKLK